MNKPGSCHQGRRESGFRITWESDGVPSLPLVSEGKRLALRGSFPGGSGVDPACCVRSTEAHTPSGNLWVSVVGANVGRLYDSPARLAKRRLLLGFLLKGIAGTRDISPTQPLCRSGD